MALFRTINLADQPPLIEGTGVFLRAPQAGDYAEWAALRDASRAFLTPWEPTWPADDLTRSAFRRRLRRYAEDQRNDQAYAYFLFRRGDQVLIGTARCEPRVSYAVGADLAGRRSHPQRVPSPAAALCGRPAQRPGLCLFPVPQGRSGIDRHCAMRAASFLRRGSRPGRPTISPAARSVAGCGAMRKTSATTRPMPISCSAAAIRYWSAA